MAEEDLTARLSGMLGTPADVATRTVTGSTRAGAQALDAALDAGLWADGVAVVVASDCPRASPTANANTPQAPVPRRSSSTGTARVPSPTAPHVEPYPGTRFRPTGDDETTGLGITQYDRESYTATLDAATDALDAALDVDAAAVQSPDGKLPYRATDALGVSADAIADAETVSSLGDTGAASTFLGAATAFADGAQRLLMAAYGSGAGATVFVVDGPVPVETALEGDNDLTYPKYLRRRGEITSDEPEAAAAYVSVPSWQRTVPQRHRLVAGRCPNCGALNFPPDGACRGCTDRPDEYERARHTPAPALSRQ